ncbi:restriction endonuclease subunit S [Roseibium album]|uniref:restriction endonuclease subunit S n=1 Tax=Roseibium album TaxID=311410 RepID=UPI00329859CD
MSGSERWVVPDGWSWVTVSKIAEVTGGGTPPAKDPENFTDDGGIPWITPADLTGYEDAYIAGGKRNLSEQGYSKSSAKLLPAGAVLLTSRAPIGYCAIAANPIATNQGFRSLTLHGEISAEFTRQYLKWSKPFLETLASGTTFLELSGSKLQHAPFPLPPLPEQKRIVAKLDALNARSARARKELSRIDTLVTRYKQVVLSKAFSGELTRDWRTTPDAPFFAGTLNSILAAPIRNGLSVKGTDVPPGVRALRLSALRGLSVNMRDVRYLPIDEEKAKRFLLAEGDILVSRGNGTKELVGIASLVPLHAEPTIFPDTSFRLRVRKQSALTQWLAYIWNAPQCRAQIEKVAKTTAGIWKISQKDLAGIELLIPELPEQKEIVRRIESAFLKIGKLAAEAKRAQELTDKLDVAILDKAFRGELVPQDPNDEPASFLLDRIKAERAAAPKAQRGRRKKV